MCQDTLTASIGVADWDAGESAGDLLARVTSALSVAKKHHENTVIASARAG